MKALYDQKPLNYEIVGNGSSYYRWNIVEMQVPASQSGEETVTKWVCDEVIVWNTISCEKITQAVITEVWPANTERKLANDYNAAKEGIFGSVTGVDAKAYIQAYKDFLIERKALKDQITADCIELGID